MSDSALKQELERVLGPVERFFHSPMWQKAAANDNLLREQADTIRILVELIIFHLETLPEECVCDYFVWRQEHENAVLRAEQALGIERAQVLKDRARVIAELIRQVARHTEQEVGIPVSGCDGLARNTPLAPMSDRLLEQCMRSDRPTAIPVRAPDSVLELCHPSDRPSVETVNKTLQAYLRDSSNADRLFREYLEECGSGESDEKNKEGT